ncbi:helix-turn-helix transcriptional regulator [Paenibacillus tianjinensis]|uniref:Helix-turn-helix transcriptional regulator n=1 Tax=Paenibacillus tianjinensis TaxID=2810347 RepID=A0ABX7L7G9_9BACL|nr:helix-turn-helix transcriptional regulator [Paenibacillus tianjinensis]QSF43293.1 helix-turn-helix transcriptional regulator [Paenibacillus tianjinensis]
MLIVKPILKQWLDERGYKSQQAFAKEVGIPQKTINNFDDSVQHKTTTLFKIARHLGITVDELFHVEEIEEPDTDKVKQ